MDGNPHQIDLVLHEFSWTKSNKKPETDKTKGQRVIVLHDPAVPYDKKYHPYDAYQDFLKRNFKGDAFGNAYKFLGKWGPLSKANKVEGSVLIEVAAVARLHTAIKAFREFMKPRAVELSEDNFKDFNKRLASEGSAELQEQIKIIMNPNLVSELGLTPTCKPKELQDYFKCVVYYETFKGPLGSPDIFCQFKYKNKYRYCSEMVGPIVGRNINHSVCDTHRAARDKQAAKEKEKLLEQWLELQNVIRTELRKDDWKKYINKKYTIEDAIADHEKRYINEFGEKGKKWLEEIIKDGAQAIGTTLILL